MPGAETCYLLDADGRQISPLVQRARGASISVRNLMPMGTPEGGCWAQRPYFQRAIESPGKPQVSRPYRTLNTPHLVATVSIAFSSLIDGVPRLRVACGDFRWQE